MDGGDVADGAGGLRGGAIRAQPDWLPRVFLPAGGTLADDHVPCGRLKRPEDLSAQRTSQPATLVIDVRSAFEYRRGHVPGAVHLPFWAAAFRPLQTTDASIPVVIYCGHGPRAWIAQTLFRVRGVRNVCLLEGHMAGWRRAGHAEQAGR